LSSLFKSLGRMARLAGIAGAAGLSLLVAACSVKPKVDAAPDSTPPPTPVQDVSVDDGVEPAPEPRADTGPAADAVEAKDAARDPRHPDADLWKVICE
jgi:hypothetical protein